jgi:hypothetical protein
VARRCLGESPPPPPGLLLPRGVVIALGALILVALCVVLAVQLDARKNGERERARKRRY